MSDTSEDLRRLADAIIASPPEYFSLDTLHEANGVARTDPAALTDRQLQHVAVYEPKTILGLVRKRAEAVQRRAAAAFDAAQAHAIEQQRAAAAHDTQAQRMADLDALSLEEICTKYPAAPATLGLLGPLIAFAMDMNERNKSRNVKIAALEARVLELEAAAAAVRS